jgi:hypothetical protein
VSLESQRSEQNAHSVILELPNTTTRIPVLTGICRLQLRIDAVGGTVSRRPEDSLWLHFEE